MEYHRVLNCQPLLRVADSSADRFEREASTIEYLIVFERGYDEYILPCLDRLFEWVYAVTIFRLEMDSSQRVALARKFDEWFELYTRRAETLPLCAPLFMCGGPNYCKIWIFEDMQPDVRDNRHERIAAILPNFLMYARHRYSTNALRKQDRLKGYDKQPQWAQFNNGALCLYACLAGWPMSDMARHNLTTGRLFDGMVWPCAPRVRSNDPSVSPSKIAENDGVERLDPKTCVVFMENMRSMLIEMLKLEWREEKSERRRQRT